MKNIIPVVMAGGSGTRLWPLSRGQYPKQFLKLQGENTMLQNTILRLDGLNCRIPLVISNETHRFIVAEQLQLINKLSKNIILEPVGRNTAPAIALAALEIVANGDEDSLMLVLAADHVIKDEAEFRKTVEKAIPYAEAGQLVTFGIVPTCPETGYGYIKRGINVNDTDSDGFVVDSFVEKPNIEKANEYLSSGLYYWNSGMFLFSAKGYLEELQKFRPDIYQVCFDSMKQVQEDLDFVRISQDIFSSCPDESVDYAVMEKTDRAVVVPLDAGWSDVGSWSSLWDVSYQDRAGNSVTGDVIQINSKNNYVYAESSLVTTVGIDDLVIIQTKDAMLIAKKDQVQDVKKIVDKLKENKRSEHIKHREIYRPWGKYDSVDTGNRYQVKRITIKPGEELSYQMHHHRAEHWVIVQGTAQVISDGEKHLLCENQSYYIPIGVKHSLSNPGKIPLEIIEVRTGSYLEDDDTERFKDKYGRV